MTAIVLKARRTDFRPTRTTPAAEQRALRLERQTRLVNLNPDLPLIYARRMATRALPRVAGPGCGCTLDSLCVEAARAHIICAEPRTSAHFREQYRAEYEQHRAPFGGRVAYNESTLDMAWRDLHQYRVRRHAKTCPDCQDGDDE